MEIRKVSMEKILPSPFNPRIDLKPGEKAYEDLKRSIEEFDCVEPLVWNEKSGHVVGGHQRLKILRARGDKEAEVVVVQLEDREEKLLNLALNKIQGDWDFTKLADVLTELDTGQGSLEMAGFDASELEAIATWTPDSIPKLDNVEIEGGGRQFSHLLILAFDTAEALLKAKTKLGLDPKLRTYKEDDFDSINIKI